MINRELDKRWEKRCPKCEGVYPPLQMFKWNGELNKRNMDWHNKLVCHNCYRDFNVKEFHKTNDKIKIGRKFYNGETV